MKNILIKLFQNRIIRVDYREYKVLRYYNDFYFSNFIGKGSHIINNPENPPNLKINWVDFQFRLNNIKIINKTLVKRFNFCTLSLRFK